MAIDDSIAKRHKKSKDGKGHSKKKRKHDTIEEPSIDPTNSKRSKTIGETHEASRVQQSSTDEAPLDSPFHYQTLSLYVALSPIALSQPLEGICAEHLSPLILSYYPPLKGVILSYSDPRLSEGPSGKTSDVRPLAKSIDEYAVSFIWVTADFLVFRPQKNEWISGWVNLQNEGHIGLVCWNLFNASIDSRQLPRDWKWVDGGSSSTSKRKLDGKARPSHGDQQSQEHMETIHNDEVDYEEGYFEDGKGKKVEGELRFRVRDIESSASSERERRFLTIEGSILTTAEEKALEEQEVQTHNATTNGARIDGQSADGNAVTDASQKRNK